MKRKRAALLSGVVLLAVTIVMVVRDSYSLS